MSSTNDNVDFFFLRDIATKNDDLVLKAFTGLSFLTTFPNFVALPNFWFSEFNETAASRLVLNYRKGVVASVDELKSSKKWRTTETVKHQTKTGLFCDEPGLGKTITVLTFIISSYCENLNAKQFVKHSRGVLDVKNALIKQLENEEKRRQQKKEFDGIWDSLPEFQRQDELRNVVVAAREIMLSNLSPPAEETYNLLVIFKYLSADVDSGMFLVVIPFFLHSSLAHFC